MKLPFVNTIMMGLLLMIEGLELVFKGIGVPDIQPKLDEIQREIISKFSQSHLTISDISLEIQVQEFMKKCEAMMQAAKSLNSHEESLHKYD